MELSEFLKNFHDYEVVKIAQKNIVIFESHNMALPIWGLYHKIVNKNVELITFDTHKDTRTPFTRFLCKNGNTKDISRKYLCNPIVRKELLKQGFSLNGFNFNILYNIAKDIIANDEHIQAAHDFKYITKYIVISSDKDYGESKDYESYDTSSGLNARYIPREEWKNKGFSLLSLNNEADLILDFDLDYFTNIQEISDAFFVSIRPLVEKSKIITVAKEPLYFEREKKDKNLSIEEVYKTLLNGIENILKN